MKQAQLKVAVVMVFLGTLSTGCGVNVRVRALEDMEASKVRYKMCLDQNPRTPANCESARLSYDADLRAYRVIWYGP